MQGTRQLPSRVRRLQAGAWPIQRVAALMAAQPRTCDGAHPALCAHDASIVVQQVDGKLWKVAVGLHLGGRLPACAHREKRKARRSARRVGRRRKHAARCRCSHSCDASQPLCTACLPACSPYCMARGSVAMASWFCGATRQVSHSRVASGDLLRVLRMKQDTAEALHWAAGGRQATRSAGAGNACSSVQGHC